MKQPAGVVLVVMDGFGLREATADNAIAKASKPNFDKLWSEYPHAQLAASGETVGLPDGQMGTSEVNHFTIGAGKVEYQDLVRVNRAIKDGSFYQNPVLVEAMERASKSGARLQLLGLVSDGGVHSHIDHFKALLKMASQRGVKQVFVHAFSDGRDTSPTSGKGFLTQLEKEMKKLKLGVVASVSGRYYAMDRDHNWERTDEAYQTIVRASGPVFDSVSHVFDDNYERGITDEFIIPSVVESEGVVREGDVVVFVNFRSDRPRQLVERFLEFGPKVHFVTMTQFNPTYAVKLAFDPQEIGVCLGGVLAQQGIKQLRITETEKFAHMTYFINCKREEPFEGEDRFMYDSHSDIPTHDYRPEMRAADIAGSIVADLNGKNHQVIFTNICNPDMVGHTGNFPAIVKAIEATDDAVGKICDAAIKNGYEVIVTADHGNAEQTLDEKGGPMTSHTLNNVPFIVVSKRFEKLKRTHGTLIDVAPTILTMLGITVPGEMTGESLV